MLSSVDNDKLVVTNDNYVFTGAIDTDKDRSLPKSIISITKCSSNYL